MVVPWPNEESAGIPKKVMTHSIKQLCLGIGLSLNPGEARVVSLLEEAVVWSISHSCAPGAAEAENVFGE